MTNENRIITPGNEAREEHNSKMRSVNELLTIIAAHFPVNSQVTLVVQHPTKPDATIILGNAPLDDLSKTIERQKEMKTKGGN